METQDQPTQKREILIVRLSEIDKRRLSDKAKEQNLTMSSYVRTTLLNNSKNESQFRI